MKFKDAIEEVRNRINIVDIIGQYVRLKRTGNNYMGICPFHNEKTPSFSVSESKQIFKCFGCNKAGNVYTFLQEHEGMTFPEAVKYLASKVNVTIDDEYKQNNELLKKKEILYRLYKDVANTYYTTLFSDEGKIGLDYFIKRMLTKETIKKFGLGYAPKAYGYMYKKMKDKGYDDSILMESKLFGMNDNGPYDFFYERVMFPLVDSFGNVVSFQGRILGDGDQKYINTSSSLIYNKSRQLFGINFAKLTKKDYYVLCEGNMDVISLNQVGIDNAVASWGTAFTIEQANLIKRKVHKVILSQDTDSAGIKAINAASEICEKAGIETYVVDYSPCKDADEFVNKYGKEATLKKLESPIPTFMFIIGSLKKMYDLNNQYEYRKYINDIVERLSKIDNALIRERYIKDVSQQESLPLAELEKSVDNFVHGSSVSSIVVNPDRFSIKNDDANKDVEKTFISLILGHENLREKLKEYISVDELMCKECKYIYEMYINGENANSVIDSLNEMTDEESEKIKNIIFKENDLIIGDDFNRLSTILNELIKKIKINSVISNSNNDFESIYNNNSLINEINNKIFIF